MFLLVLVCLHAFTAADCRASASVNLNWDPSPSPDVVGYNIYYGGVSGNYTNMVAAGGSTNLTLTGLVAGVTYYLAATATDAVGLESDYSNEIIYTVPVTTTNQPPTLNALANLTLNENAGAQTVSLAGITSGSVNETQTLTVTATSGNTALLPPPTVTYTSPNATGSLTFTPVANATGSTTVTVTVGDGAATVTRSFTVTVTAPNQAPTLNALPNLAVNANAGVQTVNLTGISSGSVNEIQTLTVTATSGNTALLPPPTVTYTSPNATGSLTFTPVANATGSTTVTVMVGDGAATVTRSFTVTVTAPNQAPTLNALPNLAVNANAGVQTVNLTGISSGSVNENQTLIVTAISGHTGLVPQPTVNYTSPNATGSLTFTPIVTASGSATVTVTVNDGGPSNNVVARSFTVTINQPPTLSALANRTIASGAQTPALPLTLGDAETPVASLTLAGTSSNPALVQNAGIVFGGSGANRTVTVTSLTGQTGTANITVTVGDGLATARSTFQLTVRAKPTAPGNFHVAGQ